jgi:class 3 adenylate cyclase/predicted ATPase
MALEELIDRAAGILRQKVRVSHRALKLELGVDEETFAAICDELVVVREIAEDRERKMLVLRVAPLAPIAAAQPVPSAPEAERRILTLMFCDLEGSTLLSGRLDAEDLREVVREYQRIAGEEIARLGGYVAQYLGDGLLVYFGFPRVREDDATRAVRAGLAILDRLHEMNVSLRRRHDVSLSVRIGIHTGEAVVGAMGGGARTETLALGQAPNIAARLEALAPSNTVVLSSQTRRVLSRSVELEPLGQFELKGVEGTRSVYKVTGIRRSHGLDATASAALIGRRAELDILRQAWAAARVGSGSAVLVRGEAGMGKSRLIQELVAQEGAASSVLVIRGREETSLSALTPIADALAGAWRLTADPDPFARVCERMAGLDEEDSVLVAEALGVVVPPARRLAPMTPQVQRHRTLLALSGVLQGGTEPRMLVIEDLHWLDPTSHEVLAQVCGALARHPLLVVASARPEFKGAWPGRILDLSPLDQEETAAFVREIARAGNVSLDLIERIAQRAEGVPLFVEELTRTVVESDAVFTDAGGKVSLHTSADDASIPSTVYGCLMARLDRLPAERSVALIGAVIGRRFPYALLRESAGLDEPVLRGGLAELVRADILKVDTSAPEAIYEFRHALLRDAALQLLLRATRRAYHGDVADALLRAFPERCAQEPDVVAYHLSGAARHAEALQHWRQAGVTAMSRFANAEAIGYFSKALEAVAQVDDIALRTGNELALTVLRAIPTMLIRGWAAADVKSAFEHARDLCDHVGEDAPPELFPTLVGLGSFFIVTADWAEACRLVQNNLALAERADRADLLVEAWTELGVVEVYSGRLERVFPALDNAIAAFDPVAHAHHLLMYGRNAQVVAYVHRSLAHLAAGHLDRALSDARNALLAVDALEHPFSRAWALAPNVIVHLVRGEGGQARFYVERLCDFAKQHGFPYWHGQGRILRGWTTLVEGGSPEEARDDIEHGLAIWHASGTRMLEAMMSWPLALALLRLGRHDAALEILDRSLEQLQRSGEQWWAPEVEALRGEVIEARDGAQAPEARACFERALALADDAGALTLRLRAATRLARHLGRIGRADQGVSCLAPIEAAMIEGRDTADPVAARETLAELRAQTGAS